MAGKPRANDPLPRYEQLIGPTLRAIIHIGGSGTVQEIDDAVIDLQGFTEGQIAIPHGEGPRSEIAYRLAWCRTFLSRSGVIENSRRGVWTLTEYGRSLDPASLTVSLLPKLVKTTATHGGSMIEPLEPAHTAIQPELIKSTIFEEWRDKLARNLATVASSCLRAPVPARSA